jgi:uncharacterized coiled-coil protein SlyX
VADDNDSKRLADHIENLEGRVSENSQYLSQIREKLEEITEKLAALMEKSD